MCVCVCERLSYSHPVSLTHSRDFTLALNQLSMRTVHVCVCTVCVNMCMCSSVFSYFPFLSVFYGLPDTFPAVCTLSINSECRREKEQGSTGSSRVSDFSSEWCNISHKMTQMERKTPCFAQCLMTEYQNSQVTETCRRTLQSLRDSHNSSLKKMRVCV